MSGHVYPMAISEDEPLVWVQREGVSRRAARRLAVDEMGEKPRRYKVRKRYMRELQQEDCPAWPHGEDEDGERPDTCRCYEIEEGWYWECAAERPGAVPVWRVELRGRLRYWLWGKVRRQVYRQGGLRERRPVLWGGRVDRNATWLDRLLIGTPRGYSLHCSDRWFLLGETELRWCRSCRATTPHDAGSRFDWCLARGHGESKAAPMATDIRAATSTQQPGEGERP